MKKNKPYLVLFVLTMHCNKNFIAFTNTFGWCNSLNSTKTSKNRNEMLQISSNHAWKKNEKQYKLMIFINMVFSFEFKDNMVRSLAK